MSNPLYIYASKFVGIVPTRIYNITEKRTSAILLVQLYQNRTEECKHQCPSEKPARKNPVNHKK